MLCRLLTCLALITGFAATGAPAHAALVEAMSGQIEAGSEAPQQGEAVHTVCEMAADKAASASVEPLGPFAHPSDAVLAPSVRMRADRAYE